MTELMVQIFNNFKANFYLPREDLLQSERA